MAKPVIAPPPSPRIIGRGIDFSTSFTATNDPDLWTAAGLPAGLTIDPETGEVSGRPMVPGEMTITLQAHIVVEEEIAESSDPVQFILIVMDSPPGMGGPLEMLLDWELTTGKVRVPGIELAQGDEAVMWVKEGNIFALLVGILRYGVLQNIGTSPALKMGFKEFEPDGLVYVTTDSVEKVGEEGDLTRYRIWVNLRKELWGGVLANYENDDGTAFLPLSELRLITGEYYLQQKESTVFQLTGGLGMDSYLPVARTLVFDGLGNYTVAFSFQLRLWLEVAGRPSQNVQLIRTLKIAKSGGNWVVSDLAGPESIQGPPDGLDWRATLHCISVEGSGAGVVVDCEVTTTAGRSVYSFNMSPFSSGPWTDLRMELPLYWEHSPTLYLHDAAGDLIGYKSIERVMGGGWSYDSPGEFFEALERAWLDAEGKYMESTGNGYIAIAVTGALTFEVTVSPESEARFATITMGLEPDEGSRGTSAARASKVHGELKQLEGGETVLSSRYFKIGIERAINPN